MRLTDWAPHAPHARALALPVERAVRPVLATLAGDPDPELLPVWGDDPERRFTLLAASPAGLVALAVRLEGAGAEPRVSGRLIRWSRLQVGELAVETSGEHRILTVTIEGQVLRVADEAADRVADFVRGLHALEDGHAIVPGEGSGGAIAMPAPAPTKRASDPPATRLPIPHPNPDPPA